MKPAASGVYLKNRASQPTANMFGVPLLECPRCRPLSAPAHLRWQDCIQTAPYTVASLVLWRVEGSELQAAGTVPSKCQWSGLRWAAYTSLGCHRVWQIHNSWKTRQAANPGSGRELLPIRWHTQINKQSRSGKNWETEVLPCSHVRTEHIILGLG